MKETITYQRPTKFPGTRDELPVEIERSGPFPAAMNGVSDLLGRNDCAVLTHMYNPSRTCMNFPNAAEWEMQDYVSEGFGLLNRHANLHLERFLGENANQPLSELVGGIRCWKGMSEEPVGMSFFIGCPLMIIEPHCHDHWI